LVTLESVFAGLVGGITWNLLTWLLGIPSSSSHALIGGIVGAMIAAVGGHGVIWRGLVSTVMVPAILALSSPRWSPPSAPGWFTVPCAASLKNGWSGVGKPGADLRRGAGRRDRRRVVRRA
jgi:Phosphate transporter family